MVTNSRMTLRLPIVRRVSSPPNFRSCGIRPIDASGKISLPSPISVKPSMTDGGADAAIAADPDVLADDGVRADDGAGADLAPGWTTAVGSINGPGSRCSRAG